MKQPKITDPVKAQAAIAYFISMGFQIDLFKLNKELPGGLQSSDWIELADFCATYVFNELAKDKVVPMDIYIAATTAKH